MDRTTEKIISNDSVVNVLGIETKRIRTYFIFFKRMNVKVSKNHNRFIKRNCKNRSIFFVRNEVASKHRGTYQ